MKQILLISFISIGFLLSGQVARSGGLNYYTNNNEFFNIRGNTSTSVNDPDDESETKFNLYISQGILNIKYPVPQELENGEIVIFNMLGQVMIRKKLENSFLNQVNLPTQNSCFIVRINYSGKVFTKKIILSTN